MKIGGFQALTLSDYPGRVAAIVFAQGCNFRCPFCHNASLLPAIVISGDLMEEDRVIEILRGRRAALDAVVVSGGEPTLQSDIVSFVERLRQLEFKVKLDTNGSRPTALAELLDRDLLDYVAMDIKAPFHKYARLTGVETPTEPVRESIALLLDSGLTCEFRTTFVPALLTEEDLDTIRSYLPEQARYTVQPFIAENAMDDTLRADARGRVRDTTAPPPMRPDNWPNDLPGHIDLLSGE